MTNEYPRGDKFEKDVQTFRPDLEILLRLTTGSLALPLAKTRQKADVGLGLLTKFVVRLNYIFLSFLPENQ